MNIEPHSFSTAELMNQLENLDKQDSSAEFFECLSIKDFKTIIEDKELFWLAYCKSYHTLEQKNLGFTVSINNISIHISGQLKEINRLKEVVEALRKIFSKCQGDYEFKISFLHQFDSCSFLNVKPTSSLLFSNNLYADFIKTVLPALADLCGAHCAEDSASATNEFGKISSYRINWHKIALSYPIPPIQVQSEKSNLSDDFYKLYKEKKLCDLLVVSKGNGVIDVHKNILYLKGGEKIQSLLDQELKTGHKIHFTQYSYQTIKVFLDYIYLEAEDFIDRYVCYKGNEFILYELFKFANFYKIDGLINCCTNLISLYTAKEHLNEIESLLKMYDNKHLKSFYEYLLSLNTSGYIKV